MSSSQIVVKQEHDVDDDYVCGAITTNLDLKDEPQNSGTNRAGTSTARSTKTITTTSTTDFEVKSEPLEIFDDETTNVNNFGESFLIYELEEKPRKPLVKTTTTITTKPTIINSKLYKKRALTKSIKNTQTLPLSAKKARLENDVATTIATRTETRVTTTAATATTTIAQLTTTPAAAATTLTTATTTTAPALTTTIKKSTTPAAAATSPITKTTTTKSLPPSSNKKPATLELKVKCLCRLGNPVAASATNVLDLKNFFDEMFNATRQLGRGQQREVKMALLKAISEAEEHVDAGRWCDKCCS